MVKIETDHLLPAFSFRKEGLAAGDLTDSVAIVKFSSREIVIAHFHPVKMQWLMVSSWQVRKVFTAQGVVNALEELLPEYTGKFPCNGKYSFFYSAPGYSLIPSLLYDRNRKDEIYSFVHGKEHGMAVQSATLSGLQAELLYAVPEKAIQFFSKLYPGKKIMPAVYPLLHVLPGHLPAGDNLILWRDGNRIDVIACKGTSLQLANSFQAEAPADIAYFPLAVVQQLRWQRENVTVFLTGNWEKGSEESAQVNRFFSSVKVPEIAGASELPHGMDLAGAERMVWFNLARSCE